jgi:hypothetical protein
MPPWRDAISQHSFVPVFLTLARCGITMLSLLSSLTALFFSMPAWAQDQATRTAQAEPIQQQTADGPMLNTLRDIREALRRCLAPPPVEAAFPRMRIAVRFSFNGHGAIQGEPRITYATPGVPDQVRQAYERALLDGLARCTPLRFSPELGAAFAGQPYTIRFIEYRTAN